MQQYDIALLGGDARTAWMLPYFLKNGYRVIGYGLENCDEINEWKKISLTDMELPESNAGSKPVGEIKEVKEEPNRIRDDYRTARNLREAVESSKCIVGGIPFLKGDSLWSKQNLPDLHKDTLYQYLQEEQLLFGGLLPDAWVEDCRKKRVSCYDFMKNESYVIENAIATAEGSILEAFMHKKTTIHGSRTLVLGYGRCGKALAHKLKGLDAEVTVCSQCAEELAYAGVLGMRRIELRNLENDIDAYEYIFNTIPALVLSEGVLRNVRKDALVLDIASAPGGVDDEAAKKMGIQVRHCYGLPGKYAPQTAAKGLAEYVIANK